MMPKQNQRFSWPIPGAVEPGILSGDPGRHGLSTAAAAAGWLSTLRLAAQICEFVRAALANPSVVRNLEALGRGHEQAVRGGEGTGPDRLFELDGAAPEDARVLAFMALRISAREHQEEVARRRLARLIHELAKLRAPSSLVVSRRAQALLSELDKDDGMKAAVSSAAVSAKLNRNGEELTPILMAASTRESEACEKLVEIARQIARNLPTSRGRPPDYPSTLYRLLAADYQDQHPGSDRGYTYRSGLGEFGEEADYTDELTKAMRIALGRPKWNPTAARRKIRKEGHVRLGDLAREKSGI
jgi:hypothetical protein